MAFAISVSHCVDSDSKGGGRRKEGRDVSQNSSKIGLPQARDQIKREGEERERERRERREEREREAVMQKLLFYASSSVTRAIIYNLLQSYPKLGKNRKCTVLHPMIVLHTA